MQTEEIKTGDTLLVTDYASFVSRMIVKVMKRWAKKKGYKSDIVLSHAGHFAWISGRLYVFGSIDSGYKPWLFENHYELDCDELGIVIMRRNEPLTIEEESKTTHFALHLVALSFMYQYWNFIQWLFLVYLNINFFRKDSDVVNYCYESEMMCRKNLNPDRYGETYQTDFFDLINDPNYQIIYKNLKS